MTNNNIIFPNISSISGSFLSPESWIIVDYLHLVKGRVSVELPGLILWPSQPRICRWRWMHRWRCRCRWRWS